MSGIENYAETTIAAGLDRHGSNFKRGRKVGVLLAVLLLAYGPALLLTILLLLPAAVFLCASILFLFSVAIIAKALLFSNQTDAVPQNRIKEREILRTEVPQLGYYDAFINRNVATLVLLADTTWARFQQLWRQGGGMRISFQFAFMAETPQPQHDLAVSVVPGNRLPRGSSLDMPRRSVLSPCSLGQNIGPSSNLTLLRGLPPNLKSEATLHNLVLESNVNTLRKLKHMLRHGADPNMRNEFGKTPLHAAAWAGKAAEAFCLLQYGANPDVSDHRAVTPLHLAVWRHHVPVVSVLLRHDANPTIPCSLQEHIAIPGASDVFFGPAISCLTPMQFAILKEDKLMVHLLLTSPSLQQQSEVQPCSSSMVRSPSDPTLAKMKSTSHRISQLQIKTIDSAINHFCASWPEDTCIKIQQCGRRWKQ